MYKIAVLGDRDSVLGFKALGLDIVPVDDANRRKLDLLGRQVADDRLHAEGHALGPRRNGRHRVVARLLKCRETAAIGRRRPQLRGLPQAGGTVQLLQAAA